MLLKKMTISIALSTSLISCYAQQAEHVYPEIKGYAGIIAPIYTFSSDGDAANFRNSSVFIFPAGINIIKSEKIGFSFEVAPVFKADKTVSKISNMIFHPGVIFRLQKGWAAIARIAFETS